MKTHTHQSPKSVLANLTRQLKKAGIAFKSDVRREGALSIDATVPGERWEIDVLDDGSVEIEVFKSDGTIHDETKMNELLSRFAE